MIVSGIGIISQVFPGAHLTSYKQKIRLKAEMTQAKWVRKISKYNERSKMTDGIVSDYLNQESPHRIIPLFPSVDYFSLLPALVKIPIIPCLLLHITRFQPLHSYRSFYIFEATSVWPCSRPVARQTWICPQTFR